MRDVDRMTEVMGNSPEPCSRCGQGIWVDVELETYVDIRYLDPNQHRSDRMEFFRCPDGQEEHRI
jgi:hypothetical protein